MPIRGCRGAPLLFENHPDLIWGRQHEAFHFFTVSEGVIKAETDYWGIGRRVSNLGFEAEKRLFDLDIRFFEDSLRHHDLKIEKFLPRF